MTYVMANHSVGNTVIYDKIPQKVREDIYTLVAPADQLISSKFLVMEDFLPHFL